VPAGGPTGWLDGITLDIGGDDRLFADDFEPRGLSTAARAMRRA